MASAGHNSLKYAVKHFCYAGGWKKFEALWNFLIKTKSLNNMLPVLEAILSKVRQHINEESTASPVAAG